MRYEQYCHLVWSLVTSFSEVVVDLLLDATVTATPPRPRVVRRAASASGVLARLSPGSSEDPRGALVGPRSAWA